MRSSNNKKLKPIFCLTFKQIEELGGATPVFACCGEMVSVRLRDVVPKIALEFRLTNRSRTGLNQF